MSHLSKEQAVQEEEYGFPYHYLNLLSLMQDVEYTSYLKIVKKLLQPLKNKALLDFGCGDGRFEYEVKNQGCKAVGIDYSKKALDFARAFNPESDFKGIDIRKFSPKQKFDCIVSIETLEHIPPKELPGIIIKLSKILKKDGKLVITVPSKNLPLSPKHYQHFNEESIKAYLEKEFSVEKIRGHYKLGLAQKIFRGINGLGRWLEAINRTGKFSRAYSEFAWRFFKNHVEHAPLSKAKRLIVICSLKK